MMANIRSQTLINKQKTDLLIGQQQEVERLANLDLLTNLPNRQNLMKQLEVMLSKAQNMKSDMALMFLDMDGFKAINDTFGHDIGDRFLQQVSESITKVIPNEPTAAQGDDDKTKFQNHAELNSDVVVPDDKVNDLNLVIRPGVRIIFERSVVLGYKLILPTTYSRSNVLALLDANFLSHQDIVLITYDDLRKSVARAASLYVHCIDILQLEIPDCIAIEDTSVGVTEAASAGIRCIGFPARQSLQRDIMVLLRHPKLLTTFHYLPFSINPSDLELLRPLLVQSLQALLDRLSKCHGFSD